MNILKAQLFRVQRTAFPIFYFFFSRIHCITKSLNYCIPFLTQHAIFRGTQSMSEIAQELTNRSKKLIQENVFIRVNM